jgi:hypothetical protein
LHIAHPRFFLFQLEKVFHDLKRYKNPGLGMKSPTPHPTKLETSWKFSEILEISWKFGVSPKIA